MLRSKDEVKMTYNQDGSFDMHFISSDIHIDRNHTARVIAPSCGDGKTTMIKYIMKHYFQYGILVAVDTIDEVKMYGEYIKNELIGYTSVNGFTLTEDDYILLYSGNEDKRFEYTYASNPMDILNKAIVVCTHHKFFNNDPRLFIHMNRNIRNIELIAKIDMNSLSIFKQAVGGGYGSRGLSIIGSDGITRRQFILIDEMPKCNMLKKRVSRPTLEALSKCDIKYNHIFRPKLIPSWDGSLVEREEIIEWKDPTYMYSMDSRDGIHFRYRTKVMGTPLDIFPNNRAIDDVNTMAILDSIYDNFDWLTRGCERNNDGGPIYGNGVSKSPSISKLPEYIDVAYNLSNLANPYMETNVWLFDGTGDLTFCGAHNMYMSIPDIHIPKFQSPITFHKVDISSGRRFKESTLFGNFEKIESILDENIKIILSIFRNNPNGKILIDSWKNLKFSKIADLKNRVNIEYVSEDEKHSLLDLVGYYFNKLTPIVDQMKANGELGPNFEFNFIHYQSGLDRATNQFREYDSVVFLGEFIVPNEAIKDHNINMGVKTDLVKYTVHQLVQAVCRTRIRKHRGEPITVYYTSDWDERFMTLLALYMSEKPLSEKVDFLIKSGSEMMDPDYINMVSNKLQNFSSRSLDMLRPKWRKVIRTLCDYDKILETAIITRTPITYRIELDEIYNLIPMNDKKPSRYNALIDQLNQLGIQLIIENS